MENEKCVLCGSADKKLVHHAEPPHDVVKCAGCGLVRVSPPPPVPEDAYEDEYYRPWIEKQYAQRNAIWSSRLRDLEKYARNKKGSLLDVGCGVPAFLAAARDNGWTVSGTEFSKYVCKYAHDELGIYVFNGPLEEADFAEGSFDAVTFWHVLEHLPDPVSALARAGALLKPGGLLIVAVPNVEARFFQLAYLLAKGKRQKLFSTSDREIHIFHFSEKTMRMAIEKTGFEVLETYPDRAYTSAAKKAIDALPCLLHSAAGVNYAYALRVVARKRA